MIQRQYTYLLLCLFVYFKSFIMTQFFLLVQYLEIFLRNCNIKWLHFNLQSPLGLSTLPLMSLPVNYGGRRAQTSSLPVHLIMCTFNLLMKVTAGWLTGFLRNMVMWQQEPCSQLVLIYVQELYCDYTHFTPVFIGCIFRCDQYKNILLAKMYTMGHSVCV